MEEESELKCGTCGERYSEEDHAPRNLGCGHSLCTSCVGRLMEGDQQRICPDCQAPFSATQVSDMVVNYPLLRLIRALDAAKIDTLRDLQQKEEQDQEKPVPSAPDLSSLSDAVTGGCKVHKLPLTFMCMRCSVLLCQECLSKDHFSQPRGQCRTLAVDQAIVEIKYDHLQIIASKVTIANALIEKLEKETAAMATAYDQHNATASTLRQVVQEVEKSFRDLEVKLEARNEEAVKKLGEIESTIETLRQTGIGLERASTPQQVLDALELSGDCLAHVEKCITQEQHRRVPVLPRIISPAKQNLREVLEKGRSVYASREVAGERRWAQVTRQDGLLHLHALRSGSPAPDGVIVPFKTVRQLVPRQCASVFLDVGIRGVLRGRVYVRMLWDTPRARQTMLLCSGEQGPCYRRSCFLRAEKVGQAREALVGGDYEGQRGSGGRTLLHGVTDGGVYRTEVVAGLMASGPAQHTATLAQFRLYLRQSPGSYDDGGHGVVTSGLHVLREVAHHSPVTDCVVHDCGLVIHL